MRIALYQPDIPQNTGTILRLSACLAIDVDIIGPTGFDISDRTLKRSAMDYLTHVNITRHISFKHFLNWRPTNSRLILLTTHAKTSYVDFEFQPDDILLLGRESKGAPDELHNIVDHRIAIPMNHGLRSLNIAVSTAMVVGEALRQQNGFPPISE